jgi:hypothetical protein
MKDIYFTACKFSDINRKIYFIIIVKILKQIKKILYKIKYINRSHNWSIIFSSIY